MLMNLMFLIELLELKAQILNKDIWEDLEVADFSAIYSVTNNLNKTTIIEEDDIFLVISPGNEISIKSLTLSGGKNVEL